MFLNFHGLAVKISCVENSILERLAKDFSFFKVGEVDPSSIFLTVECFFSKYQGEKWKLPWKKSKNCSFTDFGNKRFYNYDGDLWGEVDFKNEQATFYSQNLNLLHEVTYLYLLSRIGKKLELSGLYKIHACSFSLKGKNFLFPMLMKGGKSTLFLGSLSAGPFEILSDDAPLVTGQGKLLPFPLRVGLESKQEYPCYDSKEFYILERRRFGTKYLMDIASFKNSVAKNTELNSLFLFKSKRVDRPGCVIKKTNRLNLVLNLFINMVVGLGLPYAREFYLEHSVSDFFRLMKIGFGRLISSFLLLKSAQCFSIQLGNQPGMNAKALADFGSHDRW